jgi:hypothetical protein
MQVRNPAALLTRAHNHAQPFVPRLLAVVHVRQSAAGRFVPKESNTIFKLSIFVPRESKASSVVGRDAPIEAAVMELEVSKLYAGSALQ